MTKFQFSAGRTTITPEKPVQLGGYADRIGVFRQVADPIEANVLLICCGQQRLFLVTFDLLYVGEGLRRRIEQRLALPPEALFLAASHTHSAPMTADALPGLGRPDPQYVDFVAAQVEQLFRSLDGCGKEGSISYHHARAPYNINRRLRRLRLQRRGFTFEHGWGANPFGQRDEIIRVLRINDSQGQPYAVVWNYACHPTAYPDSTQVSADYVGIVRSRLRAAYGNIPVLFLQGFSGDLRPPFTAKIENLSSLLRRICLGPYCAPPEMSEFLAWSNRIADCAIEALRNSGAPVEGQLAVSRQVVPWPGLGTRISKQLSMHSVKLGNTRILGIGAELVARYRSLIEPLFPGENLISAGCIDQVWAYLPTDEMLAEGGYEVDGFRRNFNFESHYVRGIETKFLQAIRSSVEA